MTVILAIKAGFDPILEVGLQGLLIRTLPLSERLLHSPIEFGMS